MQCPKHPRRRHWQMHSWFRGRLCWYKQTSMEWNLFHISTMQRPVEQTSVDPEMSIGHESVVSLLERITIALHEITIDQSELHWIVLQCRILQKMTSARNANWTQDHCIAVRHTTLHCAEEDDQRYKCKLKFSLRWLMMPCCNGVQLQLVTLLSSHVKSSPYHRLHQCHHCY